MHIFRSLCVVLLSLSISMFSAAAEQSDAFVGKNEWLFYRYEIKDASVQAEVDKSIELITSFKDILEKNGIKLLVTLVPVKVRIYQQYLPSQHALTSYMQGSYGQMSSSLRSGGVLTADLNTAFLSDNRRLSDTPLFFRLDSHWSPTGVMVAAETIRSAMAADGVARSLLATAPEVTYSIKVSDTKRISRARDMVGLLPAGSPSFVSERIAMVAISRAQQVSADLLAPLALPSIALLGSSYSQEWTGFPNALRYVLQRDVFSMAVNANQGSWAGMESYLRDAAFQKNKPKILIWELPERDMAAPPDYKFREVRYVMQNGEWLRRVSALINMR